MCSYGPLSRPPSGNDEARPLYLFEQDRCDVERGEVGDVARYVHDELALSQRAQPSISMPNARFRRCAELMARWRGVAHGFAPSARFFPPLPRLAGITAACGAES